MEVNEVKFLDNITTTWMGVDKDTYYFFGRIDYSSEELEGVIDLQWEVSDYFCGDWEELMRKCKGNATQHLENTLQHMERQQELIESYQPHSKNHAIKKRRIIGLGGSKTTGAKGLKRVSDFSRAKSAPPGFGVLEEENVEKPTKKFKIKINSRPRAAIIKGNPEFRAQKGNEIENFVKKNGFVVDSFEPKSHWYPGTPKKMVYNI